MSKSAVKTRPKPTDQPADEPLHPSWCRNLNHPNADLCFPHASGTVEHPAFGGGWISDPNGDGAKTPIVESTLLQDPDEEPGVELTIASPLHEVLLNAGDRLENRLSATLTPRAARDLGRRLIALAELAGVS